MATRRTTSPPRAVPRPLPSATPAPPGDDPANLDAGPDPDLLPDHSPSDPDAGSAPEPVPVNVADPQPGQHIGHLLPHAGYTSIAIGARSFAVDPATDCITEEIH